MILNSLKDENCPYQLYTEEDIDFMKKMLKSRQFSILSYGQKTDDEIGGFVPFVVMNEQRQREVEKDNQEVASVIQKAIKKLILDGEKELRKRKIE